MLRNKRSVIVSTIFLCLVSAGLMAARSRTHSAAGPGPAVLWRDPVDIASRDLLYGPGGRAHEPHGPFTFEKESRNGSSPKFEVIDRDGVRWTVKLGDEARPETAASRLVWAAGYFANEDYFMPVLHVEKMQRLHRGKEFVSRDGTVRNARLKRHLKDQKKIGTWSWKENPFVDSREWFGLRVLMAVINNWDLKDSNNAVYQVRGERPEQRYMVSDVGASFGSTGFTNAEKGRLKDYERSKWISKTSSQTIDFRVPSPPAALVFFNLPEVSLRMSLLWLGRDVPVSHARWMGDLLGRLSQDQIRDAFRASGYSPQEVERYTLVVERRIAELRKL